MWSVVIKGCLVSFSVVHLKCEQAHSAKSQPGVDAVEMWNWICSETLVIPDSNEAKSNAGNGEQVKHRVDELSVNSPTARPSPNITRHYEFVPIGNMNPL